MTALLAAANEALNQQKDRINPRWYPRYHLAPPAGWMNDPNGLSWFDGYYHAFYQHYPWQPVWGPMHWGHARSRDMVNWEHLPIALAPEGPEDKDGCFSGSAVVDGNKLALIYTGHKFDGEAKEENLYQVQCLATSTDGVHFERQGMVLDTPLGVHHFRDPKVWQEGKSWYMVVGARVDDVGEVQLYRSQDLQHWQFASTLAQANDGMGYMWSARTSSRWTINSSSCSRRRASPRTDTITVTCSRAAIWSANGRITISSTLPNPSWRWTTGMIFTPLSHLSLRTVAAW